MIIWIRGKRKSGKTTLAKQLLERMDAVWLDGDMVRAVWTDLGFTDKDRLENNLRVARLAKAMEDQGRDVIVSTICPDHCKEEVFNITGCKFIEL